MFFYRDEDIVDNEKDAFLESMIKTFDKMRDHLEISEEVAWRDHNNSINLLFEPFHSLLGKPAIDYFKQKIQSNICETTGKFEKLTKFSTIFYNNFYHAKEECTNLIKSGADYKNISEYFHNYYQKYEFDFKNYMKHLVKRVELFKLELPHELDSADCYINDLRESKSNFVLHVFLSKAAETVLTDIICHLVCFNIYARFCTHENYFEKLQKKIDHVSDSLNINTTEQAEQISLNRLFADELYIESSFLHLMHQLMKIIQEKSKDSQLLLQLSKPKIKTEDNLIEYMPNYKKGDRISYNEYISIRHYEDYEIDEYVESEEAKLLRFQTPFFFYFKPPIKNEYVDVFVYDVKEGNALSIAQYLKSKNVLIKKIKKVSHKYALYKSFKVTVLRQYEHELINSYSFWSDINNNLSLHCRTKCKLWNCRDEMVTLE